MPKYVAVEKQSGFDVSQATFGRSNVLQYENKLNYLAFEAPSSTIRRLAGNVLNENESVKARERIQKDLLSKKDKITQPGNLQYFDEDANFLPIDKLGLKGLNRIFASYHNTQASFWGPIRRFMKRALIFFASLDFLSPQRRQFAMQASTAINLYEQYYKDFHNAHRELSIANHDLYRAKKNQDLAKAALQNAIAKIETIPEKTANQTMILSTLNETSDTRYVPRNIILKAAVQGALTDQDKNKTELSELMEALNLPAVAEDIKSVLDNVNKQQCYQLALTIGNQDEQTRQKLLAKAGLGKPLSAAQRETHGLVNLQDEAEYRLNQKLAGQGNLLDLAVKVALEENPNYKHIDQLCGYSKASLYKVSNAERQVLTPNELNIYRLALSTNEKNGRQLLGKIDIKLPSEKQINLFKLNTLEEQAAFALAYKAEERALATPTSSLRNVANALARTVGLNLDAETLVQNRSTFKTADDVFAAYENLQNSSETLRQILVSDKNPSKSKSHDSYSSENKHLDKAAQHIGEGEGVISGSPGNHSTVNTNSSKEFNTILALKNS